jgi:RimJ/RimL family protein N-acetyltransferase
LTPSDYGGACEGARMRVHVSGNVDEYVAGVSEFLAADPVTNTILLSVTAAAQVSGVPGSWFAWATGAAEDVVGACLRTPPYGVALAGMTDSAATALGAAVADRDLPGAIGRPDVVAAFAAGAGRGWSVRMSELQYVLRDLITPPPVAGSARHFVETDTDRYLEWFAAFLADTGLRESGDPIQSLHARLGSGGALVFWVVDGEPVSLAGRSPAIAGVPRIGPVYTPPEHRRRGYGAAVTAHVCADTLAAGSRMCTLFTDTANATSNGVYRRLGFVEEGEVQDAVFDHGPVG